MDTNTLATLPAIYELYCRLTGQKLTLRFDRERLWYEFVRAASLATISNRDANPHPH